MTHFLQGMLAAAVFIAALSLAECATASEEWSSHVIVPEIGHDVLTDPLTDVECVAVTVYWEARGEPPECRDRVVQVMVNRIADWGYEGTACGVLRGRGQYPWAHDGVSDKPTNTAAWRGSYLLAIEFTRMGRQSDSPYAADLLNFHADYASPYWPDRRFVEQCNGHLFYVRAD